MTPRDGSSRGIGPTTVFAQPSGAGELLYDPLTGRFAVVNATGKMVWDLWVEGYSRAEIASAFAQHFAIPHVQALNDVGQAIAGLAAAGFHRAEEGGTPASPTPGRVATASSKDRDPSFEGGMTCLSLLLDGHHDAAAARLGQSAAAVIDFIRFVEQHGLELPVFHRLDGSPARKCLPQAWLEKLATLCSRRAIAQRKLADELLQVAARLSAAGLDFIALKGPYLAARFFGGIGLRAYCDLDILVRRRDLAHVERVLDCSGFARKSRVLFNRSATTRFTHALDFVKGDVVLDLHWLLSANAAHDLDYEAVWDRRQSFVLENQTVFVLSDEHEVAFKLISIFKDLERGVPSLSALVDLYHILATVDGQLDWDVFLANRRRERIRRICVNVLALFLKLFNAQGRFPKLAAAVTRHESELERGSSDDARALVEAPRGALSNRRWAAQLYECSRFHVFLWWLISLPFRLAVHGCGPWFRSRFRHRARSA